MQILGEFVITFLLIYLVYLLTVIYKNKKDKGIKKSVEIIYLEKRYKIKTKITKQLNHIIALSNSFIMALTFVLVNMIGNIFLKVLCGFLILVVLELFVYHIIGKTYQKKERINKDV